MEQIYKVVVCPMGHKRKSKLDANSACNVCQNIMANRAKRKMSYGGNK